MRAGKEAIFNTEALLEVDGAMIDELKRRSLESPTLRFRLCLHNTVDDPIQEMIVVHRLECYSRPHYHPDVTVSFLMLEGSLSVFTFDSRGSVISEVGLEPFGHDRQFCLRIDQGVIYVPVCTSDVAVFYEVLSGPNPDGKANHFPAWSPVETDSEGVAALRKKLGISSTG